MLWLLLTWPHATLFSDNPAVCHVLLWEKGAYFKELSLSSKRTSVFLSIKLQGEALWNWGYKWPCQVSWEYDRNWEGRRNPASFAYSWCPGCLLTWLGLPTPGVAFQLPNLPGAWAFLGFFFASDWLSTQGGLRAINRQGVLTEDIATNTAITCHIYMKRNRVVGGFLAVGVTLLYCSIKCKVSFCQATAKGPSGLPDIHWLHGEEWAGGN